MCRGIVMNAKYLSCYCEYVTAYPSSFSDMVTQSLHHPNTRLIIYSYVPVVVRVWGDFGKICVLWWMSKDYHGLSQNVTDQLTYRTSSSPISPVALPRQTYSLQCGGDIQTSLGRATHNHSIQCEGTVWRYTHTLAFIVR